MSTPRPRPQVMKLTDRAAARVRAIMAQKGSGTAGLRIGVKKGGCAGMEYTMEWASEPRPFDEVIEYDGARVLIDPKAVMYLLGSELDRIRKVKTNREFKRGGREPGSVAATD